MTVSVIIPTWNSADSIVDCLQSAVAQWPAELIVVDNGSTDATRALVERRAPRARLVALPDNTGFAAACNRGIAETSEPFVLLLNDDVRLQPGYIRALVDALEARLDYASAVGKLVWVEDGVQYVDSAGILLRRWALGPVDRGHGERDSGQYDREEDVFGPSAAAALYRRNALDQVGPPTFDESFFAYYEDVDLAWRLRRAGWKSRYVPSAVAHHRRRGPDDKPPDIAIRAFMNRYLLWLRNESLPRFGTYAPLALGWEAARLARRPRVLVDLLRGLPQLGIRMARAFRYRLGR